MQVEGQHRTSVLMATGARVSNAYITYLLQRDSPRKLGLIPHGLYLRHLGFSKVSAVIDGCAYY